MHAAALAEVQRLARVARGDLDAYGLDCVSTQQIAAAVNRDVAQHTTPSSGWFEQSARRRLHGQRPRLLAGRLLRFLIRGGAAGSHRAAGTPQLAEALRSASLVPSHAPEHALRRHAAARGGASGWLPLHSHCATLSTSCSVLSIIYVVRPPTARRHKRRAATTRRRRPAGPLIDRCRAARRARSHR